MLTFIERACSELSVAIWDVTCHAINIKLLLTLDIVSINNWIATKKKWKKIRVNGVTDSNEKQNIESESQRGVVINKPTRKNKNGWIGRCLPLILNMQLEERTEIINSRN